MSKDISTAHQRAVLTKALANVDYLVINYSLATITKEELQVAPYRAAQGYITMKDGRFYIYIGQVKYNFEVFADGSSIDNNLRWWLD